MIQDPTEDLSTTSIRKKECVPPDIWEVLNELIGHDKLSYMEDIFYKYPNDPKVPREIGGFLIGKDHQKAHEYLDISFALDPEDNQTLQKLGDLFWEESEYDKACNVYRKAIQFCDNVESEIHHRTSLATILGYHLKNHKEAIEEFEITMDLGANAYDYVDYLEEYHSDDVHYIFQVYEDGLCNSIEGFSGLTYKCFNKFLENTPEFFELWQTVKPILENISFSLSTSNPNAFVNWKALTDSHRHFIDITDRDIVESLEIYETEFQTVVSRIDHPFTEETAKIICAFVCEMVELDFYFRISVN